MDHNTTAENIYSKNILTITNNDTATLPRNGRNPFKNIGAKIVEKVRRSLSRSSRGRRESQEKTPVPNSMISLREKKQTQIEKDDVESVNNKRVTVIEKPPTTKVIYF